MILGAIADDLTGASDLALTLAEGGMRTVLHAGIPAPGEAGEAEALVVALKIRTVPPAEAVRGALAALARLGEGGARTLFWKVCSTFDSTPEGNIGPVAEALAAALGHAGPVVVCPAFPATGRTVYQGHLFVGDRLLSESGMERHPLTPMTDPDLRRWLAPQGRRGVGHLPLAALRAGEGRARLEAEAAAGRPLVIADAVEDADLHLLAEAARGLPLLVGGSGLALGLPATLGAAGGAAPWRGQPGPGVILAGSCSGATLAQVAAHREAGRPARAVDPAGILGGRDDPEALAAWALSEGAPALVHSSALPEAVTAAQAKHGREGAAEAVEGFFARLASAAVAGGATRIVVAGGETSGAVVEALGLGALAVGPAIAPGVPALAAAGQPAGAGAEVGQLRRPGLLRARPGRAGGPRPVSAEARLREEMCLLGRSLFDRGLTAGASGNLSARLPDGRVLVTPTGLSLGRLDPARLATLSPEGRHLSGDAPTKEVPLHAAFYATRAAAGAVAHLHSSHAVALSMLPETDPEDALPPLTAYGIMRLGRVKLLPVFLPGDPAMGEAVRGLAGRRAAVLLANHGPVVAGRDLEAAVHAVEELEETAKLALLTRGLSPRLLTSAERRAVVERFDVEWDG